MQTHAEMTEMLIIGAFGKLPEEKAVCLKTNEKVSFEALLEGRKGVSAANKYWWTIPFSKGGKHQHRMARAHDKAKSRHNTTSTGRNRRKNRPVCEHNICVCVCACTCVCMYLSMRLSCIHAIQACVGHTGTWACVCVHINVCTIILCGWKGRRRTHKTKGTPRHPSTNIDFNHQTLHLLCKRWPTEELYPGT